MGQVTVKLDRAHLMARFNRGKDNAGAALAEQILGDSKPYTPHQEGYLETSGKVEKIGEDYAATWNEVYAAYQYYGCWPDGSHVIQNHTLSEGNPNATTQWVEAARREHEKDWHTVAQREFVKGAGG